MTDELMTETEFLSKIKTCRETLNKFKRLGLISHLKVGRRVYYDAQSLEDYKENCALRIPAISGTEYATDTSEATERFNGMSPKAKEA